MKSWLRRTFWTVDSCQSPGPSCTQASIFSAPLFSTTGARSMLARGLYTLDSKRTASPPTSCVSKPSNSMSSGICAIKAFKVLRLKKPFLVATIPPNGVIHVSGTARIQVQAKVACTKKIPQKVSFVNKRLVKPQSGMLTIFSARFTIREWCHEKSTR